MTGTSLQQLKADLEGEIFTDELHKAIYATDASVYRKHPIAIAYPKNKKDIKRLIAYARDYKTSLIPRTAGTSLAGQCVGEGIVVDTSKYLTRIVSVDKKAQTVTVEPGVIRDELNQYLKPCGLFFGPNTSTSNRCMIGGMVGNNSSGTTSIKYGVTRDKVLAIEAILSDGSEVVFEPLSGSHLIEKTKQKDLEGKLYKTVYESLTSVETQKQIVENFPKPEIHRRNTGYAIDELIKMQPFKESGEPFNMCKLLAGSEGTLAFTTRITLKLDKLPPENNAMVAAHFKTIRAACMAVAPCMKHDLATCEMMDKVILDCTKSNKTQLPNRFFVEGDPEAILMLELHDDDPDTLNTRVAFLVEALKNSGLSYANPVLYGEDINKAMELRKAGLGLLGNMIGDKKAVACIEDTAVAIDDLAPYIDAFSALMNKHKQKVVYYAHAGAGELHLRPILNLKKKEDVKLFRTITTEVAELVRKYKGSLSGEHGDGIVRAEFIEKMIGSENYTILKQLKQAFDPKNIFNPGKIIDPFPMDAALRYEADRKEPVIDTFLDFSDSLGILRATEKCNGSGDCRKTHLSNGAMCPSYHATKDEKDTTRARANALREFLTNSGKPNKFDQKELKEVFDLCLSCKACSSECPSNVDVAILKTEFLYQYQKQHGSSLRDRLFAHNTRFNKIAATFPWLSNKLMNNQLFGKMIKNSFGIASKRKFPKVSSINFDKFLYLTKNEKVRHKKIILFIDEFTQYTDIEVGKDAIVLLTRLGYNITLFYGESGRTYLSKGFLKAAKRLAVDNVDRLKDLISDEVPLIGLEPSAILSFRDEYKRLVDRKNTNKYILSNSLLIEEFIVKEVHEGTITPDQFTKEKQQVKIHVHCHQKTLSNQKYTFDMLNLPKNYTVTLINSGCCGMAGSFGYENEHYDVSMAIGSLKLFPAIKKTASDVIIAANGTSCRHQILDGTGRIAKHPVTILKEALL
ncbi:FAD-binding and (Fe-S)-binding domain-containing protein [Leptobacterium sp. I13]|uniref:FAD-binding and (Fe-S)-binding domain-containing protein n=1 Tax=Leptobacterium meishanense TaxID=3128904 RepID=UPI0030EB48D3